MTDAADSARRYPDPRIVEIVAACLCWAKFPGHAERNDDPLLYWQQMPPEPKRRYMRDAELIASAMMSDRYYAVVPVEPTGTMIDRGMIAGRGIRSVAAVRAMWREMVTGARVDLRWRSGDVEDSAT